MASVILTEIKDTFKKHATICIGLLPFLFIFAAAFNNTQFQHFSVLADAFLHGKLSFLSSPHEGLDTVFFQGKYYWPLGPFPAVLLMPFVAAAKLLHIPLYESFVNPFLFVGIFLLCYRIAKKLRYTQRDALFWAYAFCFSSPLLGIAYLSTSWYFAHMVVVLLLCIIIAVYLHKRNYLLLGFLMGLILATRVTAGFAIVFFLLDIITRSSPLKTKARQALVLLLPFVCFGLMLLWYNYARFGDVFEQGYSHQLLFFEPLLKARNYGTFSLVHIPGNIYYFLFASPIPVLRDGVSQVLTFPFVTYNNWGLGLFVTSPYFLYLFLLHYHDRVAKLLWLTIIIIAIPIFLYYGIGPRQFGYRYALDFLPLLFWLLMRNYRQQVGKLTLRLKLLIVTTCLWNIYLLLSAFAL